MIKLHVPESVAHRIIHDCDEWLGSNDASASKCPALWRGIFILTSSGAPGCSRFKPSLEEWRTDHNSAVSFIAASGMVASDQTMKYSDVYFIWLRPATFLKRSHVGLFVTAMNGKAWTRSPRTQLIRFSRCLRVDIYPHHGRTGCAVPIQYRIRPQQSLKLECQDAQCSQSKKLHRSILKRATTCPVE